MGYFYFLSTAIYHVHIPLRISYNTTHIHIHIQQAYDHSMSKRLSNHTSLLSYTKQFNKALTGIAADPAHAITLDGGPHTFWW